MVNEIKWTTPSTSTKVINGNGGAPTAKNLSSGGRVLSNEIVNISDKKRFMSLRLRVRGASAFAVTDYLSVYLVSDFTDAAYEDGDSSTTPAKPPAAVFPVRNVSTQQVIDLHDIPVPPFDFKLLLVNNASVALTNTDNENELYERRYDEEIQ